MRRSIRAGRHPRNGRAASMAGPNASTENSHMGISRKATAHWEGDLKSGRGGLRDIQLLDALAVAHLTDRLAAGDMRDGVIHPDRKPREQQERHP